jgi:hypothetical protein
MQYRTLEQTKEVATVLPAAHREPMSKRERLERWAELLEQHGGDLRSLFETEHTDLRRRRLMREDGSPLALAFHDPVLRGQGLKGDTYGDAMDFFGLSHGQLHNILCYCRHGGTVSARIIAVPIRDAAFWANRTYREALVVCSLAVSAVAAGMVAVVL